MAGASLAAAIAPHRTVALLEAEEWPGHHATGRSAAFWTESYGGPAIQPLTLASRDELDGLGVLSPRGALHIARTTSELADFLVSWPERERMFWPADPPQARVPGLSEEWRHGVSEPTCADIDVAALHTHYLAQAIRDGVTLHNRLRLDEARRSGGEWRLFGEAGERLTADVLVDAAGAWADEVAGRAGARAIGLTPKRRTVVQLRLDRLIDPAGPLVLALDGSFYFKPVGRDRVWLSPGDEGDSGAVDAVPDEWDVALALDRFTRAVDWPVAAVERRWAGLRTFAPDRAPVIGWDAAVDGLFWFAGQGGWGIQTAPAAAALAAGVLMDECVAHPGNDPARFKKAR